MRQQAQREKNAPVKIAMIKASVVRPVTAVTTMAEMAATPMTSSGTPRHMCAWLRDAARDGLTWDASTAPLCASSM